MKQWISFPNAWLLTANIFQTPWYFHQVNQHVYVQEKRTVLFIYCAWIICCYFKSRGGNFYWMTELILCLCCCFFFNIFLRNCNRINLQGYRTILSIYFPWIIHCNIKNTGVNFILKDWTQFLFLLLLYFFGLFFGNFNHVDLQEKKTF